jgi:Domain of unknown function (DUF4249)
MKIENILLICVVFIVTGCLDTIDIDIQKSSQESIIIQGTLTKSGDAAEVKIFTNLSSSQFRPTIPIRVKSVLLINDAGQNIELKESGDGQYSQSFVDSHAFKFEAGMAFKCKVITINDDVYESTFKSLKTTPKIDQMSFKRAEITAASPGVVDIYLNTLLSGLEVKDRIFKWDVIQSYKFTEQLEGFDPGRLCYATNRIELLSVPLLDARNNAGSALTNFSVSKRKVDYHFSEGYYCTVVQQIIDPETYNFFVAYNALIVREGNIFEPPAGKIPTNIYCINRPEKSAYGYFYAVEQDTARIYIDPKDVGMPARQCPMPPGESTPCPTRACCDCLTLPGSSLVKPVFWN